MTEQHHPPRGHRRTFRARRRVRALAQSAQARGHHHHRPRLHAGRQCRPDRAPHRRAAGGEARPAGRRRAQARRRRLDRRGAGRARRARRHDAVSRRRRACGVGRDLQQAALRRAEGLFLDQHAVGLSLRVRHLSRIIRRRTSPSSSRMAKARRGQAAVRHARQRHRPASGAGAVRGDRRDQGPASCRIAARRRPRPICSASASTPSWTT